MRLLIVDGTNMVMRYACAMVPGADLGDHPAVIEQVPAIVRAVEKGIRGCAAFAQTPYVIVALDSTASWRRELYPAYKAGRTHATTTWTNRLGIHLASVGIVTSRAYGYEADDVIATLVTRAAKAGHLTAVLSGDSDMLMLASMFCDVYQFGRKDEDRYALRTMRWIREKYQLPYSHQLAAYKALVGEPGDNLPGVPGIGAVKARKILGFNTTAPQTALSAEQFAQYELMLTLVTLRDDVPVDPILPSACRLGAPLVQESA